ncbi:hypothetical protein FRB99_001657, partial [Tulasnella sp. 403]
MESLPSGLTTSTFNQGGSLPYESPELLLGESLRAQESDVWAWGCVLQEDIIPLEALRIKKSDLPYDGTTPLGSGRFGTVYRARLRRLGVLEGTPDEVVAVKELFHMFDDEARARLERNVQSWAALKHPNVVPFRGFCEEESKVLLVSPHHPGGSLAAYLERDSLTYARRTELATETAQGLLYLHTRDPPILHGNIHPGNVFVSANGTILLSDYGISTVVNKTAVSTLSQIDDWSRYQSLEILTDASQPTAPSDVITGKTPYESVINTDSLAEHIRHDRALPATVDALDCPPRAQNIMGYCWKLDPELRPRMGDVLAILTGQAFRFQKVTDITLSQNYEMKTVDAIGFSRDGLYIAAVLDEVVQIISTDTWKAV